MRVASKVWMPCPGWNMGGRTWKHGNIYPSPCQLKQKTTNHHTHFNLLSYNRQAKKERRDQKLLPSTGTRLCTHSQGSYMARGADPSFCCIQAGLRCRSSDDKLPVTDVLVASAEWLITSVCNFPFSDGVIPWLSVLIFGPVLGSKW